MANELSEQRKGDGEKLVAALRHRGLEVYAAFWAFHTSLDEWRLYIVTPDVENKGPRAVLRQIDAELVRINGRGSFDLFDIEVSGTQNPGVINLIDWIDKTFGRATNLTVANSQFNDKGIVGTHMYSFDRDRLLTP